MILLTPAELAAIQVQRERDVLHTRQGQPGRWSKLPEADIARIRELWAKGLSQYKIAAEIGCTQPAVSMILRGKRRVA